MSWDIYGEPLRRGHCEVHPHVHEEYPCSVCISEKQAWDQAQAAMLAAAPTVPADAEEIHVNVEGDSVYTLPLEPTGRASPRFVVHVPAAAAEGRQPVKELRELVKHSAPAPDEREIAARPGYAGVTVWVGDQECTQVVDRALLETSRADELLRHFENARHLLRAGKEGVDHG